MYVRIIYYLEVCIVIVFVGYWVIFGIFFIEFFIFVVIVVVWIDYKNENKMILIILKIKKLFFWRLFWLKLW